MIIIKTTGISMRPLLVTGDLVTVSECHGAIPFGTLVYATTIHQQKVIHRYLGKNMIKGDRVKNFDQIIRIEGLVNSRMAEGYEVSLNQVWQRYFFGTLNFANQRKFILFHRLAAGAIEIIGKVLR